MLSVGIGEYAITDDYNETLITHALGSCVAVIMHCKVSKHTALAHVVLPKKSMDKQSSIYNKPSYFANDIVPKLAYYFLNDLRCGNNLEVKIIGGANSKKKDDVFLVGEKNLIMINNLLKEFGIKADFSETGGNISRTVSIKASNGEVNIIKHKMIL